MRLFEYEVKEIFKKHGIPVPEGGLAKNPLEARRLAAALGTEVVIKAQVLSGGRGKAGGIRFAAAPDEVSQMAGLLLGEPLQGLRVNDVLVERRIPVDAEIYLGMAFDPRASLPVLMISMDGGVDIEEVPPHRLHSALVDPLDGLPEFRARQIALEAGVPRELLVPIGSIANKLFQIFQEMDAIILEINPLALTNKGQLVALDAKLEMDEDSLYRHPELSIDGRIPGETQVEALARKANLRYVELDGNIGICGNGAGMMMTAIDLVMRFGGKAANFCEAGGAHARAGSGAGAVQWWRQGVETVLANPRVKALLINVVGGNHRGDEVGQGIVEALAERKLPVVIRLSGTRQDEGRQILRQAGYHSYETLEEAAQAVVEALKGS
jgi:succinyl-CoA synthetase beta subunit